MYLAIDITITHNSNLFNIKHNIIAFFQCILNSLPKRRTNIEGETAIVNKFIKTNKGAMVGNRMGNISIDKAHIFGLISSSYIVDIINYTNTSKTAKFGFNQTLFALDYNSTLFKGYL